MKDDKFYYAMKIVFAHEGGYCNDKDDLGGATNMGITQTAYNSYCKRHNLKTKDVKYLKKDEAENVYYYDYWLASGADKIDNKICALIMFDTAVLHGVSRAKQFFNQANGDFFKILDLRKQFYINRTIKNPSQKKFLKGWNNRVNNLEKLLKSSN